MVIHNFPDSVILTPSDAHRWKVRNVGSGTMPLPLWEEENSLVFKGNPVEERIRYVYIPAGDEEACRKVSFAGSFLWRSMTQAPEWHCCSGVGVMEFSASGQWYETISLLQDAHDGMDCPVVLTRYLATDDPNAEKLGDCGIRTNRLVSECEVVGLADYCEKIRIPATVNGRKVERVDLPEWCCSPYLREFVVEEGIGQIHMNFDIATLERIEIPENAVLSEPPNGILNTAWFQRQEGDVYFHGYYCGTRGKPSQPVLHLKEGTVGILAGAQGGEGRQGVALPKSLCYIGPNALRDVRNFQRHRIFTSVPTKRKPAGLSGAEVTPENLYQLGRTGFAAGHLIPEGYTPVAPLLTYENVWIAHYYYTNEFFNHIQYYLALHLATGTPVAFEALDSCAGTRPACWRTDRLTEHFSWSEDYLTRAAAAVRNGVPQRQVTEALLKRWWSVVPYPLRGEIGCHIKENGIQYSGRGGWKA